MLHAATSVVTRAVPSREASLEAASFPERKLPREEAAPSSTPALKHAREAEQELEKLRDYASRPSLFKLRMRLLRLEYFSSKGLREAVSVKLASGSGMDQVLYNLVRRGEKEILKRFTRLGADPYHSGKNLLAAAGNYHSFTKARSLAAALLEGKSKSRGLSDEDREIQKVAASTIKKLNQDQFGEFHRICRKSSGPLVPQGYLLSIAQAQGRYGLNRAPLAEVLPQFLNAFEPRDLIEFVKQIGKGSERAKENFLPELLALLKHPRTTGASTQEFHFELLNAINADAIHRTSQVLFRCYQKIGVLCHSFQKWRFEAMRTLPRADGSAGSLLEAFGFTPITGRATDETQGEVKGFGPGYLLLPQKRSAPRSSRAKKEDTHITAAVEFRRAYLMAHEEGHGTLIIRNSSTHFGRDTLRYPAYWAPPGRVINAQKALMVTRDEVERNFIPLPLRGDTNLWEGEVSIAHLVKQIELVSDGFSAWKCNTRADTAWSGAKKERTLKGGFYSEGFLHLLEALKTLVKKNKELGTGVVPELAFVHRRNTPWAPFVYTDAHGRTLSRLPIDEQKLSILERLAARKFVDEEEITSSGIRAFFQQAGFNAQGELVLLAPGR